MAAHSADGVGGVMDADGQDVAHALRQMDAGAHAMVPRYEPVTCQNFAQIRTRVLLSPLRERCVRVARAPTHEGAASRVAGAARA